MAVSDCKTTFRYNSLEECFNAPLNLLRYSRIAKYGYKKGKKMFFHIILYHYFHDYELLENLRKKYNIRKPFT